MLEKHLDQARRQGAFEGVHSNSPSGLQKILYIAWLYILSSLPFVSDHNNTLTASLLRGGCRWVSSPDLYYRSHIHKTLTRNWCSSQRAASQPLSVSIASKLPWSKKLFTVHSKFCTDCNGSVHNLFQVRALQICNRDLGQLTVTGLWKYIL